MTQSTTHGEGHAIDPKELTEAASQLRTVHFSLLVACLACLVALSVSGPLEVRAARESFTQVRNLEGRDPGLWLLEAVGHGRLKESIASQGKRLLYAHPDYDLMLRTVGTIHGVDMAAELPDLIVSAGGADPLQDAFFFYDGPRQEGAGAPPAGVGRGALAGVERPADLKALWDALGATTGSVFVPTAFKLVDPSFLIETPDRFEAFLERMRVRFPIDFRPCQGSSSLVRSESASELVLGGCWIGPTHTTFDLELTFEKHPLLLLPKLAGYLGHASAEPRFERAFPALAKRMVGKAAEDFDVLDSELTAEDTLAKREQTLKIFSADIPLARLNLWGTLILLAVQLYLLIHLGSFTSVWSAYARDHGGAPYFSWIGLYPGRVARLVTTASICALPLLVIATLSWQELRAGASGGLRWAAVGGALLLSALAWRQLRRLRRVA